MYPRTVDELLQQIHVEYEGDTDFLEFDDEETQLRVFHLKEGVREWVRRFPEYRETITDLASAADGDKTTTGSATLNCPTNFIKPTDKIKIGSTYLDYISPDQMSRKLEENSSAYWFTVTGRPGAYKIKTNPTFAAGSTISYDYHKTITIPTNTTSVVEISRPNFVVHYVLWKIFAEDDAEKSETNRLAMLEDERLERVELAKNPSEPNRLFSGGAGFGDTSSSVSDIFTDQ